MTDRDGGGRPRRDRLGRDHRDLALGYNIVPADPPEGERILADVITERLVLSSSGALMPLTPGSTQPIAAIRRHAGIAPVLRFTFTLP